MTQSGQQDQCDSGRCPKHGLASIWGEACVLCLQHSARKARLMAVLSSASTVAMIVTVLFLAWNIDHKTVRDAQNKKSQSQSLNSDGLQLKVVAARTRAVVSNTRSESAPIEAEAPPSNEDQHLGEAAPAPRVQGASAPAPPRAPVDREPETPDDPRDFELPARAR